MAPCYPLDRERPATVAGEGPRVTSRARARSTGLVVRDLGGEVIVYDKGRHRAHCLNRTAAFVFRHADGRRTAADIAALLGPGADEDLVGAALEQLAAAGLLETDGERAASVPAASVPSRRDVMRQVGLGAAVLAPAVASLLVPTPAEAAATCIPAASCTSGNVGQACYNSNPATECSLYTCQGPSSCTP
jgi:hypothetical protein